MNPHVTVPATSGQAVEQLADALSDSYVLEEIASAFSCIEADRIAVALTVLGYREAGVRLLAFHALDDGGDEHEAFADGVPCPTGGSDAHADEAGAERYLAELVPA